MHRFTFDNMTLNNRRVLDRFVAPRESLPGKSTNILLGESSGHQAAQGSQTECTNFKKKQRIELLNETFGIKEKKKQNKYILQSWPCIPRKNNFLSWNHGMLDLPSYSYSDFTEIVDCSKDNIVVSGLGNEYNMWRINTHDFISQGSTEDAIQCCKFDPAGKLIVFGTSSAIEIHKVSSNSFSVMIPCQCHRRRCSITAIDWSPTGKSFVSGCSYGILTSFDCDGGAIDAARAMNTSTPINLVRVSPDARYVVAVALNSRTIPVMAWPSLDSVMKIHFPLNIRTIAWHPWRSGLLGVGGMMNDSPRIMLWDNPKTSTSFAWIGENNLSMDGMLFSHKTGELVLSLSRPDEHEILHSKLMVLSNPDTVVDQINDDILDHVRWMVFSSDGTKLVTATAQDELLFWNFLPEDNKEGKSKRFHTLPTYIDEATDGYSLR